jgi:hypothetical protein
MLWSNEIESDCWKELQQPREQSVTDWEMPRKGGIRLTPMSGN